MEQYDFDEGKKRINEILENNEEIQEKEVPKDDTQFTYSNGIKSWIGSIFVDIVKSSELIKNEKEIEVSKILRVFSSEIITILNSSDNVREIGIRGDCVYGIYNTPTQNDTYELMRMASYINTSMKMINKLLKKHGLKTIEVGIGVSIGKDLIVKAGKKGTGINDKIWIGDAVVKACNLANMAGRNGKKVIGFSSLAYSNFINILIENNDSTEQEIKNWFIYDYFNDAYFANIVYSDFIDWIEKNI